MNADVDQRHQDEDAVAACEAGIPELAALCISDNVRRRNTQILEGNGTETRKISRESPVILLPGLH
jgi:hypothetical protein